jgi:KUP system potassium uptake protein
MEGLTVATPQLEHFVVPGAMLILLGLFLLQKRGTGAMGRLFGPITLVWLVTLALLGLRWIVTEPGVLLAINPVHAVSFFAQNGAAGFLVLASVFLAITGGEALYADMGHFGRSPIRRGWFWIVLPTSGRARCCCRIRARSRTPSICSPRAGFCRCSSCWQLRRR